RLAFFPAYGHVRDDLSIPGCGTECHTGAWAIWMLPLGDRPRPVEASVAASERGRTGMAKMDVASRRAPALMAPRGREPLVYDASRPCAASAAGAKAAPLPTVLGSSRDATPAPTPRPPRRAPRRAGSGRPRAASAH